MTRFTLSTLLMLTAVVGAAINLAFVIYRESRPIPWETFTYANAEELQCAGKTVLFFGNPSYHVESQLIRQRLDESRIAVAAHRGHLVALMRTYSDWNDPEIHAVWKRFGHTKRPMILVFTPDGAVTQMDPLNTDKIEQQLSAHASIPIAPSLALVGTVFAWGLIFFFRRKQREQCRAPEDGITRSQMESPLAVPGDG